MLLGGSTHPQPLSDRDSERSRRRWRALSRGSFREWRSRPPCHRNAASRRYFAVSFWRSACEERCSTSTGWSAPLDASNSRQFESSPRRRPRVTAATTEPGRGDSLLKHTAFRVKSTLPSVGSLLPPVGSEEYEAPREHPSGPRRANRGVATPVASRPSMYGEATVLSRSASVMCIVATRCPLSLGRHFACRVKAPLFGRAEHEAPREKDPRVPAG